MNIRRKVEQYLNRRRAAYQLNQLDDHLLADIGISRSQIDNVVGGR